jgi:hypothetical protein
VVDIGHERHGWLGLLSFRKIDELQEFLKAIEFNKSKFLATGKKSFLGLMAMPIIVSA